MSEGFFLLLAQAAGCRRQPKGGKAAERSRRRRRKKPRSGKKSTRSVPSRQGHRREAAKEFKFVCAKLLSVCGESRFGKPRNFLQGNDFILFACTKRTKSTRRAAALSTPGTIQISARFIIFAEVTGVHHVPGRAGHCKLSGYRR